MNFAGTHLILDLYEAKNLNNLEMITQGLRDAAAAVGATVLDIQTHYFEPQGGVTGVAMLAESHVSIHTWPEYQYAAIDLFVCGQLNPFPAIAVFKTLFETANVEQTILNRGKI